MASVIGGYRPFDDDTISAGGDKVLGCDTRHLIRLCHINEPRTMSRILTLGLPEAAYRALERHATSKGQSPETAGATVLIDAIERLSSIPGTGSAGPARTIVWEGPQLGLHSFAQVNREFCLRLIERGHELALIPSEGPRSRGAAVAGKHRCWRTRFHRSLAPADRVRTCSHQWPPSFVPPPEGHWVIVQPWEFGSLPRSWVGPMIDAVDEVWAYSRFVRDCYIAGGVPADRVHVVPLGVDPRRFHPGRRAASRSRPRSHSDSCSSGARSTARGSTSSWRRTPRPSPRATRSAW